MDAAIILIPLVIGLLTSLPAVILAIATLVQVLRVRVDTDGARKDLNGRLDQLLREQEARIRAEYAPAITRPGASGDKPYVERPPSGGAQLR